jgi:hypothetical protein
MAQSKSPRTDAWMRVVSSLDQSIVRSSRGRKEKSDGSLSSSWRSKEAFHGDVKRALRQVSELLFVAFEAFKVFFFEEDIDAFLDIGDFGVETSRDLRNGLLDELDVLHFLPCFHYSDDGGLR